MSAEALECPVCLELPEGEVHQCNEGHCYCAACWNRLEKPRRCPECRQPVAQANRNRTAERAIAALEWSCEHCGEATTRGAKASHLAACPQVPTACAAAVAGCGWAGMMSEQAAHEAACPFVICQRMMAPLQAQNTQLQSECQELRGQVAALLPLQRQVAALQPLAGRVRALEGVETEEGGRRQRQRVGPAPHDAPPSDEAVEVMGLAEAVAALRAHVAVARVAVQGSMRLRDLSIPDGSEQAAADAGAIEAVLEALRAHPQEGEVQEAGCCALAFMCRGGDNAAARARRAAEAGAIELVVDALRAHPQAEEVPHYGCWALTKVCGGDHSGRAAEAGAVEAVVEAMRAHPQVEVVQELGCDVLEIVCHGGDAAGRARKQRAVGVEALEVVLDAMRAHLQVADVMVAGCKALLSVCGGGASAAARARRQRVAQAGGRRVVAAALARPYLGQDHAAVQEFGQKVLDSLPE